MADPTISGNVEARWVAEKAEDQRLDQELKAHQPTPEPVVYLKCLAEQGHDIILGRDASIGWQQGMVRPVPAWLAQRLLSDREVSWKFQQVEPEDLPEELKPEEAKVKLVRLKCIRGTHIYRHSDPTTHRVEEYWWREGETQAVPPDVAERLLAEHGPSATGKFICEGEQLGT